MPGITHPDTALLIAAHGASENTDSALPALRHAARVRSAAIFAEVHCGFWKQSPHITEVFKKTLSLPHITKIIIQPFFLAEGYFSQKVIPDALGINTTSCNIFGKKIFYSKVPGLSPLLAHVMVRRASKMAAVSSLNPARAALILVGHGTDRHQNTGDTLYRQVEIIRKMGVFAECHPAFMEMQPLVSDWATITPRQYVMVVPFFVANGLHAYEDIPVLLGITKKVDTTQPRWKIYKPDGHLINGRRLWYCPSIGYEPQMTQVLLDCALSSLNGPHSADNHHSVR